MPATASPVRAALYTRLSNDTTLTSLLAATSNVFHQVAPQTATPPYVIFHKQAGTPRRTYASRYDTEMWLVKAVDKSSSASTAETIAARIDVLLDDYALAVTGRTLMSLQRASDVDYPEAVGADVYRHVGALYRIDLNPS